MNKTDILNTWKSLGGIPLYEDDTDDLFENIASLCLELENSSLDNKDIMEIFNLLPNSLGEDYYGITYRVIELLEYYFYTTSDIVDTGLAKKTEWLSAFVLSYPDRLISK